MSICKHFGACGGCTLQHMPDAEVAAMKRAHVVETLARAGIDTPVAETVTVPPHSRRRVKLAVRRTRKTAMIGYRGARSHDIIAIEECPVARPEIVAALPVLRDLGAAGASRGRAVELSVTVSEAGLDVAAEQGKELDLDLRMRLAELAEAADLARLTWGAEMIATRRPPVQRMGKALVAPPPGAFLQAAKEGEAALVAAVRAGVGEAAIVADLFAGCGSFTLPLAERAAVSAYETDEPMLEAMKLGWRGTAGALRSLETFPRDLFREPLHAEALNRFDAVVFDPPRAGAKAQCEDLAASRVPVIVGVSCVPATFARDAAILRGGGYRLTGVLPVDQFRWSRHVELVGVFRR